MKMNPKKGFTLIEVLIALMILAISLTAIVKASSTDISNTNYLKNKALANLVTIEAFELIKMHAVVFNGNKTEQKTQLGNATWFWQAIKSKTETKNIYQVSINVSQNHQNIASSEHYIVEDQQ